MEEVPAAYRDASPTTWVDEETVPFLLIHSIDDDATPIAHARLMAAALHEANVEMAYVELARGGNDAAGSWAQTSPLTLTFLQTQLHPER